MEFIHAPKACASVGPYSHCVKAGSTYYLCGQVPFHPVTGEVVGNGMKEQAVQTLANMKAVLEAAGLAVTDIAKTTVFVTNMDDFAAFNEVYAAFMGEHRPARVCVEVSNIAHGCLLEMDAICFKALAPFLYSKDTFIRFDGNMFFLRYMGIGKEQEGVSQADPSIQL